MADIRGSFFDGDLSGTLSFDRNPALNERVTVSVNGKIVGTARVGKVAIVDAGEASQSMDIEIVDYKPVRKGDKPCAAEA